MIVLFVLGNCAFSAKTRKRKAVDPVDREEEMRRKRSVEDWRRLSRTALDLVVAELSLEPRGTNDELAEGIHNRYNSQAADATDTAGSDPSQRQE